MQRIIFMKKSFMEVLKKTGISLLLGAITFSTIVACGNNDSSISGNTTVNENGEVINLDGSPVNTDDEEAAEDEYYEELPEGYVRSSLTNELVTEEVANTRPIAVMIPMDECAQPDYGNSRAGVVYECLVEGSITRTMNIIEDWESMEKIGNIRSTRDYFIFWSWEWDAILLHDGGPALYVSSWLADPLTNNINGLGYRESSRSAPHNEYYTADLVNKYISSYGYEKTHRDQYVEKHFSFAPYGGQTILSDSYGTGDVLEVYAVDLKNCYPVTKTRYEYNPDDGLYYRFIYGKPHMDNADEDNPVQLAFSNIILQRAIGCSRDDHDYRAFEVHKTTEDGWFITNGQAIHITWQKTGNETPTRFFDDYGNEIKLSTGKTIISVIQDGGSASLDFIFEDSNGDTVDAEFDR